MPLLRQRALAGLVDALLALMVTGVLVAPLLSFSTPQFWSTYNPVPIIWALVFILTALISRGQSPGKRWLNLHVVGGGCLACREIRRMAWALVWGAGEVVEGLMGRPDGAIGGLIAMLVLARSYDALAGFGSDARHNTATGFEITQVERPDP